MSRIGGDASMRSRAAGPQGADPLRHRRRPARRRRRRQIMQAMAQAGADVIELGVPFCDPMADGPVIQKASERALARGIGLAAGAGDGARVPRPRRDDAGRAHGLCQPDRALRHRRASSPTRKRRRRRRRARRRLPAGGVRRLRARSCEARGIDPIFLLAPTSTDARIASVGRSARSGYVYYVSLKGVTGAGHFDIDAVAADDPAHQGARAAAGRRRLRHPRRARPRARSREVADAVVIGSALVQLLEGASRATRRRGRRRASSPASAARSTQSCARAAAPDAADQRNAAMSWLEKLLPPKIQQTDPSERRTVPEGLWIKCPACETVLYKTDLEKNLNVCPKCGHHHRIGARARLDALPRSPKAATRSARKCCRSTRSSSRTARSTPSG